MSTKLSNVIIIAVALMMITSGIALFMTEATTTYTIPNYNASEYESYDRMSELASKIETFEENKSNVDQNNNNDVLGALFSSTYTAAETIKGTGSVVNAVANDGIDQLPAAEGYKDVLKTGIGIIIAVFFVIFFFMAFIIKNDRV